jgi:hypothetical protein
VDDPQSVNSVQEFDGIDAFLWANLPFAVRKNGSARFAPSEYMTDYLSKEAVKAIDANRHRPFFLYFAPNAPHTPLQALRSDYDALPQIADHRLRVYAAMIRALDRAVGRILAALDANGLADNTLVFFTSDNGGANYIGLPDINQPYRGWKMTFFEAASTRRSSPAGRRRCSPGRRSRRRSRMSTSSRPPRRRPVLPARRSAVRRGRPAAVRARRRHRQSARCRLLALGRLPDGARRRLEAAGRRPAGPHLALSPDGRSDRAPRPVRRAARQGAALRAMLDAHDREMVPPAWPSLIEGAIPIDHPLGVPDAATDEYVYWDN